LFLTILGALRNLVLDVTSGSIQMTNNQFSASSLVFGFPPGSTASFDYDAGLLGTGAVALSGAATNNIGTLASINGGTLSVDIDTVFKFTSPVTGNLHLTGKLVASQTAEIEITSIQVQGQTVTLQVQGAGPSATLQSSTDLKTWGPQSATQSPSGGGTAFTFPVNGTNGFFRVME
jgi:hypothetical protein